MNFLILGSGFGSRFRSHGFNESKPYIKLGNRMLYQHVIDNYKLPLSSTFLTIRRDMAEKEPLPTDIPYITIDATSGPAESVVRTFEAASHELLADLSTNPLAVLDCDCWLSMDLVSHVEEWITNEKFLIRQALVVRVPFKSKFDHFTTPVPVKQTTDYSRRFVPRLQAFNKGVEDVNPGLYFFHEGKTAYDQCSRLLRFSKPDHGEATMPRVMSQTGFSEDVGVVDLRFPFTSAGTPEEYRSLLSEYRL